MKTYVALGAATGTAPNPRRFMPIPNRSMSCALPNGFVCTGAVVAAFPFDATGADRDTGASFLFSASFRRRSSSSCLSLSRS